MIKIKTLTIVRGVIDITFLEILMTRITKIVIDN